MISIIIASVNAGLLKKIKENVATTIGIPYEILVFENSNATKGLCEIYNLGAQKAVYHILCFMHEDIAFRTENWGEVVLAYFNNPNAGALGLAGSSYKSASPAGWGTDVKNGTLNFRNFIQHFKDASSSKIHEFYNPLNVKEVEVLTLDGMWFCTTKTIALRYPFNEKDLKGFHCYDLDFCLNVGCNYKLSVTYEILIEHFSAGGYNKAWIEDTLKVHRNWKNQLPKSVSEISKSDKALIEFRNLRAFILRMTNLNYDKVEIIKVFNEFKQPLSWYLTIKLKYYMNKEFSKRKKKLSA